MQINPEVWLDAERKRRDDLVAELVQGIKDQGVDPEQLPLDDVRAIALSLAMKRTGVDRSTIDALVQQVVANAQGYAFLQPLFADNDTTEIQVVPVPDKAPRVFVVRNGMVEYVGDDIFPDAESAFLFVKSKADKINKEFSAPRPIVDLWLPDGSRVNAQGYEACPQGVAYSIRKSPRIRPPLPLEAMVANQMMSPFVAAFLVDLLVKGHTNFGVFGRTDSGKTALLRALARFIDSLERTIIGEPTWELFLPHLLNCYNLVEVRRGDQVVISARDIIEALLRSNPDRVIWAEFRGGEVVQVASIAQSVGLGFWTTAHFGGVEEIESRLPKLYQAGGLPLAKSEVHDELYATFKFMVFSGKIATTGKRVIKSVVEITKDGYNPIIEFDSSRLRETGGKEYRWTAVNPPTKKALDLLWENGADVKDEYLNMSGVV